MKFFVASAAVLTMLLVGAETLTGRVVRIADGDTMTVLSGENVQEKIRLNRIDAPEKSQAFGEVSRRCLADMVAGKEVRVEWEKRDKYGRILGDVSVGTANVNLKMVRDGLAWHYKRFDESESFALAEDEAREKKIGLWGNKEPIAPLGISGR